jgi:hypothetical protein
MTTRSFSWTVLVMWSAGQGPAVLLRVLLTGISGCRYLG